MRIIVNILMVGAALVLFGWTAWKNVAPGGVLEARYDFGAASPFITSLLPGDRALPIARDESGTRYQSIIGEPVYFRVKTPRTFDRARVEIRFQNPTQPILEVGGLAGRNPDVFDLYPLQNRVLDSLEWSRVTDGTQTLYERVPTFATVQEFLSNPPARAEIATYHARLSTPFRIPGYTPDATVQTIDYSLRGSHTFYAYVKNESLDVTFFMQDMNRDAGGDPVAVTVYAGQTPVGSIGVEDDGRTGAGEAAGVVTPLALVVPGLPEGAYRIEVRTTRDMFIRKIETRSKKFVVANEIFLGDEAGYRDGDRPVTLWTTARTLRASTLHADGAQELRVGGEVLRIPESHREYHRRISGPTPTELFSPQGDLIVRTSGVFAFSRGALFMPEPVRLSWDTDLDAESIHYILATYEPPRQDGDWYVGAATFDLSKLLSEDHAVPFVISAPGVSQLQNEVRISSIAVRLERPPESLASLFQKIWSALVEDLPKF